MPKLSPTQKLAVCAMKALHDRGHNYFDVESIGWVISPYGGVRNATIDRLEELGLIVRQQDDLPYDVKVHLLCSCAKHRWRLSDAGVELADGIKFVIDDETEERLESSSRILERYREAARE